MKFARRSGGTNDITNKTLTADEVVGAILDGNNSFIPIAVGPFGRYTGLAIANLFEGTTECTTSG